MGKVNTEYFDEMNAGDERHDTKQMLFSGFCSVLF